MGGDSEYEPKDSRNVTGKARTSDGRWSADPEPRGHRGEYEPRDSRNVTGTASTPDGRWTNRDGKPPLAAGRASEVREDYDYDEGDEDEDEDDDEEMVAFEPDPELRALIRRGRAN